jgi:hypothetical protein
MCIVEDERSTVVCDVAIGRVRQELEATFADGVTFTVVAGHGTRVQATPTIDAEQFAAVLQQAIVAAQQSSRPDRPDELQSHTPRSRPDAPSPLARLDR